MLASGSVPFDSKRFTLSVTGGTGKYRGARGQVKRGAREERQPPRLPALDLDEVSKAAPKALLGAAAPRWRVVAASAAQRRRSARRA